jgi:hypothetical protein
MAPPPKTDDPEWKIFEKDVAALVETLDPSAHVQHDVKRTGLASGRTRQMDVVVTGTIGDSKMEVAVECKHNKTEPIDIAKVDAFVGKVIDFGSDIGVMCAFGGFDAGARARAAGAHNPRIELRDLGDWPTLTPWQLLTLDFVRDLCPDDSCRGDVLWEDFRSKAGTPVRVGHCDRCGQLVAECEECASRTILEYEDVECDGRCGAEWHLSWGKPEDDEPETVTWVPPYADSP